MTAAKILLAEQLLHELASLLLALPFDGRMHLRALALKREVRSWEVSAPDSARVDEVLAEIRAMLPRERESVPPPSEAA